MKKEKIKIVAIGGGSSYTPELIEGFIERFGELAVSEICLVDIQEGLEKLEVVGRLAERMVWKSGCGIRISATLDRRLALEGADFVITQFRVGGLDARIKDERIPLKYGCIGQETTGPGGFAKALRTIPVILELCRDMEELCPDAWLINFTNPAGIVTETILSHSKVKAVGLCNCPIGMYSDVAKKLNCSIRDVYCDFVGLNHLLWARKIFARGEDVTKQIVARAHETSEIMRNIPDLDMGAEFFNSLGMLPIGYLKYYYHTQEMFAECVRLSERDGVRGETVKKTEAELFALYRDPNLNVKPPQLSKRGGAHYSDAACDLILSIHSDKRDIQTVCVKNNGANLDLPDNAVIERNCVIGRQGAAPIALGHMPLKIRGLVQLVKAYEQLTVEAGVHGDRDAALQALALHPLVPSAALAKSMLDELISSNAEFLPQFRKD
jgi:6-phospho-beta-glucosidase